MFRRPEQEDDGRWIVVGLGNPGARYEKTRHNLGAMVLDALAKRTGAGLRSHKSGCLTDETKLAGERVVLARPTSYMNESGRPVGALMRWYKADPERLIVVHDELDIPFDEVRVKLGGGVAGHNGLRSVASHLGTKDFIRVRVGVSRPPGRQDAADYVLSEFSSNERKVLPEVVERAADAVELILERGVERAMNDINTKV
ncbi:MAG: peptidyl-tRNA hydrolase, family [Actinomycetota bacterium]|nr:peptidyl-tRNA hydrolase, family [Actinomycetota bacterium]